MIDKSLLNELVDENPDLYAAIVNAIKVLGNSGILERQLNIAFESIASGSVNESEAELATRILNYRRENHGIIALKALSDQLMKESTNA